jgi:hypothetical protein
MSVSWGTAAAHSSPPAWPPEVGSRWAVTTQGSSNTVIADNVVNDITVYGWDQKALYKSGDPFVVDRGRELGMTNRIDRVPA